MTKKPIAWLLLVAASVAGTVLAWKLFPSAFPIVSLELAMDRPGALAAARQRAETLGLLPSTGYRQAVSFDLDSTVRNHVELRAGGAAGFAALLDDGVQSPYRWSVRHFTPGEVTELTQWFRPDGRPLGFVQRLPEDAPGAALDPGAARALAEETARADWDVDLTGFELVEEDEERRPGGRVDHRFVYERECCRVADAAHRLVLGLAGDRLSQVEPFLDVPEAFLRDYAEMRSANEAIASVGTLGMLVFLIAGCFGLVLVARRGLLEWKPAVVFGAVVGLAQGLDLLNAMPLAWMGYDTATSPKLFVVGQVVLAIGVTLGSASLFSVLYLAGENLTRWAFPEQVQLWKSFHRGTVGSDHVTSQVVIGYLVVGIDLAFLTVFYYLASTHLGWWSPSDTLVNPNALSTYLPWLSPVATSLQAGTWEECLCRAVPLAGAVLLGRRYGRPKLFLVVAFVLQALVFGAGHASYPAQPAHARLLELIIPSFIFGYLYLRHGLLTAMVMHYVFDVVLIGLPIWVAQGAWLDRGLLTACLLLPLLVVTHHRLRRATAHPDDAHWNHAWRPPPPRPRPPAEPAEPLMTSLPGRTFATVGLVGLFGLGLLVIHGDFRDRGPAVGVDRSTAERRASKTLTTAGIELGEDWRELTSIQSGYGSAHEFAWRELGERRFEELVGSYLPVPRWRVRRARFDGADTAERAEEHRVYLSDLHGPTRHEHLLPESRPGAELSEDEARALAHVTIVERYELEPNALEEIRADVAQRPSRRDWTFVFHDPAVTDLAGAQARLEVRVRGDRVRGHGRYLHVPEDWMRADEEREVASAIRQVAATLLLLVTTLTLLVMALGSSARGRHHRRAFFVATGATALMLLVGSLNDGPVLLAGMSTAEPIGRQLIAVGTGVIIQVVLGALMVGLFAGMSFGGLRRQASVGLPAALAVGFSLAFGLRGLMAVGQRLGPGLTPPWPSPGALATVSPLIATVQGTVVAMLVLTVLGLTFFQLVDVIGASWTRRQGALLGLLTVFGLAAGQLLAPTALGGVARGIVIAVGVVLVSRFVLRHHVSILPPAIGAWLALGRLFAMVDPDYTGHRIVSAAGALAAIVLGVLGWHLVEHETCPEDEPEPEDDDEAAPDPSGHRSSQPLSLVDETAPTPPDA
ncbi:MAG: type II CAAX endopeptidase family protein [Acidobacteriota bacterium]